jgi:hypothetical protein
MRGRRLRAFVCGPDLVGNVHDRGDIKAAQEMRRLWVGETVDGLEQGDSSARPEDAVELADRLFLLIFGQVDQHRACGRDIDGVVPQRSKVVGGEARELTAIEDLHFARELPGMSKQLLGDVAQDDPSRGPRGG